MILLGFLERLLLKECQEHKTGIRASEVNRERTNSKNCRKKAEFSDYVGGKKIKGTKRSILVDTLGLLYPGFFKQPLTIINIHITMSKIINTTKRYLFPWIAVTIVAPLTSCTDGTTSRNIGEPNSAPTTTQNSASTPISTPKPAITNLRDKSPRQNALSTTPEPSSDKNINVTIYISDNQCQSLIPQQASVPAATPIKGTVGKILEQRDTGDFSLSGYRVNVNKGIATVDLRISPESKRQLASLSSCEQFALFGSLRKTLTSNAGWNIKEVHFTERGQEIVF